MQLLLPRTELLQEDNILMILMWSMLWALWAHAQDCNNPPKQFIGHLMDSCDLQYKASVDEWPATSWFPSSFCFIIFNKTGQPGLRLSLSSIHNSVLLPSSLGMFFKKVWKFPDTLVPQCTVGQFSHFCPMGVLGLLISSKYLPIVRPLCNVWAGISVHV